MEEKYSDELLNMKFSVDVMDGIKPEKTFFSITEETLKDVYGVLPSDPIEVARKKIMDVVSQDDFLYDYFNKDRRVWEIRSFEPGYWTTPAKEDKVLSKNDLRNLGYTEKEISKMKLPVKSNELKQTYQQKLTIKFAKRNHTNVLDDTKVLEEYEEEFQKFLAHDNVFTTILKNKFESKEPKKKVKAKYDMEKALIIPDVELHLGKLGSKWDSTDSYDYKKALYRYVKVMLEAEKVQKTYKANEVCMTIGNDFYNTDTEQNTTTAGTEQHNDTRFQQMIANGIVAHVWAIERMKKICGKVVLKFHPGNHDYLTDYTLYMQLYYLYRNDPKVEIDCRVKDSRWATSYVFGKTLNVFAHGKTPEGKALNDDSLSLLPNTMFKEEARKAEHIIVHAGHLHSASLNNFASKKRAANGTTVIRNGSLQGEGAWDSGNLYAADKTHQVHLIDYNDGLYATFNLKLDREELEKGISLSGITDDTNYVNVVEDSIENTTEEILLDDIKKAISENEKDILRIKNKYGAKMNKLRALYKSQDLSDDEITRMLTIIGYDEEIKPYLERREKLKADKEALTLTKKPRR